MTSKKESPSRRGEESLAGTTLRVYRYIYKYGPVRLHDIERALGFSSSSTAEYHINKLLRLGIVRAAEAEAGYVADRIVFENMLRVRRTVIPVWTTFGGFLRRFASRSGHNPARHFILPLFHIGDSHGANCLILRDAEELKPTNLRLVERSGVRKRCPWNPKVYAETQA
jgi:predicted DNA-binding transcriptional regulator